VKLSPTKGPRWCDSPIIPVPIRGGPPRLPITACLVADWQPARTHLHQLLECRLCGAHLSLIPYFLQQGGGEKRKLLSEKLRKPGKIEKYSAAYFYLFPIQKRRKLFSEITEETWRKRKRKGSATSLLHPVLQTFTGYDVGHVTRRCRTCRCISHII